MDRLLLIRFGGERAARGDAASVSRGPALSPSAAQDRRPWLPAVSHAGCLREAGRAVARLLFPVRVCACLFVKPVREPDAGNLHVRFDERGGETERGTSRRVRERKTSRAFGTAGPARHRAPPRLYHRLLRWRLGCGRLHFNRLSPACRPPLERGGELT